MIGLISDMYHGFIADTQAILMTFFWPMSWLRSSFGRQPRDLPRDLIQTLRRLVVNHVIKGHTDLISKQAF